ncbi:DUF4870 domain-containing protein [bacterium]|nr:DUF4870 domain-containing protein [bacterium]MCI0602368.1 DUF4870 domain-containing protein [bacterium]
MEQSHQPLEQQPPSPPKQTSTGLEPNLAGALSYLCGWVTGLIFFLMEKENSFVRFHAMQSIMVSAGFTVLFIAAAVLSNIPVIGWLFWIVGYPIVGLASFVAWILLMVKAYQGERFHFPVVGDLAEKNV